MAEARALKFLGPFHGAIAVTSVTRYRHCRQCAGGERHRVRHLVNGNVAAARSGEWAQHFSNASCFTNGDYIKSCQKDDKSPLKGVWFCSRD